MVRELNMNPYKARRVPHPAALGNARRWCRSVVLADTLKRAPRGSKKPPDSSESPFPRRGERVSLHSVGSFHLASWGSGSRFPQSSESPCSFLSWIGRTSGARPSSLHGEGQKGPRPGLSSAHACWEGRTLAGRAGAQGTMGGGTAAQKWGLASQLHPSVIKIGNALEGDRAFREVALPCSVPLPRPAVLSTPTR